MQINNDLYQYLKKLFHGNRSNNKPSAAPARLQLSLRTSIPDQARA